MSPMGRGQPHWWRRLVTGGLMGWVTFEGTRRSPLVMPGLVPGIHVFGVIGKKVVDGRDKPGHDGELYVALGSAVCAFWRASISCPNSCFPRKTSRSPFCFSDSASPAVSPAIRTITIASSPLSASTKLIVAISIVTTHFQTASHHRLHAGQRVDEVTEGGAADFEVAVLVEGGAGRRQQHDRIGKA